MDDGREIQVGQALREAQAKPLRCFARRMEPSPEIVRIAAELGLRYPPRNTVDESDHAARVALLAEDCADLDPEAFDCAAREWAKTSPFFPKACELRELAIAIHRLSAPKLKLIAPPAAPEPPESPPLTDDEIAKMPEAFVRMGIKMGEIDEERAAQIRGE